MAVQYFNDFNTWKQAVLAKGLVVHMYPDFDNYDDPWTPSWAVELGELGLVYEDSPMFGCFQNIPTNVEGTTYSPEGFLCDTEMEFALEMRKDEERHDALSERQHTNPSLH